MATRASVAKNLLSADVRCVMMILPSFCHYGRIIVYEHLANQGYLAVSCTLPMIQASSLIMRILPYVNSKSGRVINGFCKRFDRAVPSGTALPYFISGFLKSSFLPLKSNLPFDDFFSAVFS